MALPDSKEMVESSPSSKDGLMNKQGLSFYNEQKPDRVFTENNLPLPTSFITQRGFIGIYMQVTIWENRNLKDNIALWYSLGSVPWMILGLLIIDGLSVVYRVQGSGEFVSKDDQRVRSLSVHYREDFWFLLFVCSSVLAVLNEYVIKPMFRQPRPSECPNKSSYGMPSGHSVFSFQVMTMLFWAAFKGIVFCDGKSVVVTTGAAQSVIQISGGLSFMSGLVLTFLSFAPVPWARVHNKDHTQQQVVWGACFGAVFGLMTCIILMP